MNKSIHISLILLLLIMNFSICRAFEVDAEKQPAEIESLDNKLQEIDDIDLGNISEMVVIGGDEEVEFVDYYELGKEAANEDHFNILPPLLGFLSTPTLIAPLLTTAIFAIYLVWKVNVPHEYLENMTEEAAQEFINGYSSAVRIKRAGGFLLGISAGVVVAYLIFRAIILSYY